MLVDAPANEIPADRVDPLQLRHACVVRASTRHRRRSRRRSFDDGDQALPRLPKSGLVRWLGTRGELAHLIGSDGRRSAPLPVRVQRPEPRPMAVRPRCRRPAGGGRGPLQDRDDSLGQLHPGEVVEFSVTSPSQFEPLLAKLLDRPARGSPRRGPGRAPAPRRRPDDLTVCRGQRSSSTTSSAPRRAWAASPTERPVLTSRTLDQLVGARLRLKVETFQRGGAFKFRGAYNAISSLAPDALRRGVCTASLGQPRPGRDAGGLAVRDPGRDPDAGRRAGAEAGRDRGLRGRGRSPSTATRDDREQLRPRARGRARDLTLVHPYDNPFVMAGQGTVALELLAQAGGELDALVVPVGGGGLISGTRDGGQGAVSGDPGDRRRT